MPARSADKMSAMAMPSASASKLRSTRCSDFIAWFGAIWAASVAALGVVAWLLRLWIA